MRTGATHGLQGDRLVTDWDRIVREQGPRVYAAAWRILGHAGDAEDVVQDVFLEVHRLWTSRPVRYWPALLHRLATCRALDRLRQRKTFAPLDGCTLLSPDSGPEGEAVARELARRLREAVAGLPDREAAVFCLRYFEDHSYHAIAQTLGITHGAVATALHKARGKLEALLTTECAKGKNGEALSSGST